MKRAVAKPGWKMSEAQALTFWRLWQQACRAQKWSSAENEQRRRQVLSALGFASIKEVGMTDDFDRVKAKLLELCDRVINEQEDRGEFIHHGKDGRKEPRPDTAGQRRRYLHRIGEQLADLTEVMGGEAAAAYLRPILQDRFNRVTGVNMIQDLPTKELEDVVMTLDRCLHQQKQKTKTREAQTGARWNEEVLELAGGGGVLLRGHAMATAGEGDPEW
jgi:hypothetical protein